MLKGRLSVGKRSDKQAARDAKVDEYKRFIVESYKKKIYDPKFYGTREQYGLWLLAERQAFKEIRENGKSDKGPV
jgi:hypothetical protein